ncbi:carbohydrate binding family 9 domain-containing protein, partial [bacterium]|nr:carbohydrate binding family 9 domain-containing protein [bacterium]
MLSYPSLWAQTVTDTEKPLGREVFAQHTHDPITVDGILDELAWQDAVPATDFIQREPYQGEKATEKTEIRVLYDDEAIYFGVWAYDREPEKLIINHLEQDFSHQDDDGVSFYIDTFNDDRNSYGFYINPVGAKREMQSVDEGKFQIFEWEDVWDVKTQITEEGWFAEVRIPFKSLRFSKERIQTWGINFQRRIRRRNEQSFWAPMPRRFTAFIMSYAGDLKGMEDIPREPNFKLKPFMTSDFRKFEGDDFDTEFDVGLDLKYSLTAGLTLDLTYNTDFSQVEVDTQQINLTRFSLFFPEKRDFFLENATLFRMGDVPSERGSGTRSEETQLFYSRRIGLSSDGQALPLLGGARLSGQIGSFSLGLLNIHQEDTFDSPSNNFTVARLRRDILARSDIGAIFINRAGGQSGDYNRTYGLDANLLLQQKLNINTFVAATQTPGLEGENVHSKISGRWDDDYWYTQGLFADIGTNFNPEVGFVSRRGVRNYQYNLGLKPRTEGDQYIRELHPHVELKYFTDRQSRHRREGGYYAFEMFFRDGSRFELGYNTNFERLLLAFPIHPGVIIPPGDYFFNDWGLTYASDGSKLFYGSLRLFKGDFYDGSKTSARMRGGLSVRPRIVTEVTYEYNSVDVNAGQFQADLYSWRFNYSFSPTMFIDTFLQYNSTTEKVLTNVRFNWEHHPLSHLSVVFTEDRLTGTGTDLSRAII